MSICIPGLFITGTDTGVGKTYVGAMIAQALVNQGLRVGVYKPAASGCRFEGRRLIADDAVALWNAAGRPGELDRVCPQRFAAPLAPHLAAREEGKRLDAELLRDGIGYWRERSDILVIEGAGGLMSPLGEDAFVADLALYFGYPLIVVSRNALGTINQTLLTLMAAETYRGGIAVAGVVLNRGAMPLPGDMSADSNRKELEARCEVPILAEVMRDGRQFSPQVDWLRLAR